MMCVFCVRKEFLKMEETLDLTACIAKGKKIKIEDKEYEIKLTYRALRVLEQMYGSVGQAIEMFGNKTDIYGDVLNFLYAMVGERYNLRKVDIEDWISLGTINILYDVVYAAVISAFGVQEATEEQGEQ